MGLIKDLLNLNTWASVIWVFLIALNSFAAYRAETVSDGITSGVGIGIAISMFLYTQLVKRANDELLRNYREVTSLQHGQLIRMVDKIRKLKNEKSSF